MNPKYCGSLTQLFSFRKKDKHIKNNTLSNFNFWSLSDAVLVKLG